jgi:hypothetical protein
MEKIGSAKLEHFLHWYLGEKPTSKSIEEMILDVSIQINGKDENEMKDAEIEKYTSLLIQNLKNNVEISFKETPCDNIHYFTIDGNSFEILAVDVFEIPKENKDDKIKNLEK